MKNISDFSFVDGLLLVRRGREKNYSPGSKICKMAWQR